MGKVYWRSQEAAMEEHGEMPAILALGDSWFWYPANNLLNPINRFAGQPTILCYGDNGAEAVELLHPNHFEPFRKSLDGYPSVRIVLLSAGGNDFAGLEDFEALLNEDCSALATPEAPGSIERIARAADETRFRKRDAVLPLWERHLLKGKLATTVVRRPLRIVE